MPDGTYIKIGRLKMSIAKEAHVACADIMIDKQHLAHIQQKHSNELNTLGINAVDFVNLIVRGFSEIREAPREALNLVIDSSDTHVFTAVITLNYNYDKKFWEINTALPMRCSLIKKRKLLWKRERTPKKNQ